MLSVDGVHVTRDEARRHATPGEAPAATLERLEEILLFHREARRLTPYQRLDWYESGSRYAADHFAPARFCAAIPARAIELAFAQIRHRYVHPDLRVVVALEARCRACPLSLPEAALTIEAALTDTPGLSDDARTRPDALATLSAPFDDAARAAGLAPTAQTWTVVGASSRDGAPRSPEHWTRILPLSEGGRTQVLTTEHGLIVYVLLEGLPSRRGTLEDPAIRADVQDLLCKKKTLEGRSAYLQELRRHAQIQRWAIPPAGAPWTAP